MEETPADETAATPEQSASEAGFIEAVLAASLVGSAAWLGRLLCPFRPRARSVIWYVAHGEKGDAATSRVAGRGAARWRCTVA